MRHVRMLGLCLVAALALGACVVSSASAATPEWGQCYAKAGGKYENSNCTVKAKGKTGKKEYEWRKGAEIAKRHFEGANLGSGGVLSTNPLDCKGGTRNEERQSKGSCEANGGEVKSLLGIPLRVECESEKNTGEASGKNDISHVAVIFRGCKLLGSAPCTNGTEEGEIIVNPLKGQLGYIEKSSKSVGVVLTPEKKKGEFAKFNCLGTLNTVVGVGNSKEGAWYSPESKGGNDAIISPITPVDQMTNEFTQTYTINEATDENIPSHFEGKPNDLLEDYVQNAERPEYSTIWSPAGEAITNVNHPEEEVEIKA